MGAHVASKRNGFARHTGRVQPICGSSATVVRRPAMLQAGLSCTRWRGVAFPAASAPNSGAPGKRVLWLALDLRDEGAARGGRADLATRGAEGWLALDLRDEGAPREGRADLATRGA